MKVHVCANHEGVFKFWWCA